MWSIVIKRAMASAVVIALAACGGPEQSQPTSPEPAQTSITVAPSTSPPTTAEVSVATTTTAENPIELSGAIGGQLRPGTYVMDHDQSPATSLEVRFTLAEPGWEQFDGVFKNGPSASSGYVAVKFLEVDRVASPACDATVFVSVPQTTEALATALGGVEDFITLTPPTGVNAFGYDGYHLVLQVPDLGSEVGQNFEACDDTYFDGYEGPTISRYYQGPEQFVEFWVLDVGGIPLVIETTWFPDSPAEHLAELRAILDTVVIQP